MSKTKKKVIILLFLFSGIFLFYNSRSVLKTFNLEQSSEMEFPYFFEIENYEVEVEYTKFYKNYLLTKYYVKTKDGSSINKDDIYITTAGDDIGISYTMGPQTIISNIKDNRLEVISTSFIAATEEELNDIKVEYIIGVKNQSGFENIKLKEKINLTDNGYKYFNKKIEIDGIKFTIMSIGNFEFGSILHFFTENIESDNEQYIMENYNIKVKYGNKDIFYNIKEVMALMGIQTERLASLGDFNINSKYTQFFSVNMLDDLNAIDLENMEIYMVNKMNNKEVRII